MALCSVKLLRTLRKNEMENKCYCKGASELELKQCLLGLQMNSRVQEPWRKHLPGFKELGNLLDDVILREESGAGTQA